MLIPPGPLTGQLPDPYRVPHGGPVVHATGRTRLIEAPHRAPPARSGASCRRGRGRQSVCWSGPRSPSGGRAGPLVPLRAVWSAFADQAVVVSVLVPVVLGVAALGVGAVAGVVGLPAGPELRVERAGGW